MAEEAATLRDVLGPEVFELASETSKVLADLATEKGLGLGEACKASVVILAGCALNLYQDAGIPGAKHHAQRVLERALEVLVLPLVMHND